MEAELEPVSLVQIPKDFVKRSVIITFLRLIFGYSLEDILRVKGQKETEGPVLEQFRCTMKLDSVKVGKWVSACFAGKIDRDC